MKLFLCPNNIREEEKLTAEYCISRLEQNFGMQCFLSQSDSMWLFGNMDRAAESPEDCDLIVAIGGDGSVLRAAQQAVRYDRPLVGINGGRIGYLCALELSDLGDTSRNPFAGLKASNRSLLGFSLNGSTHFAVNDIVVAKNHFGATVDLEVSYRGDLLARWRGDGVILSTPTGSTAYNISAHGPILLADVNCFALTPICPHTLDSHPFVFGDSDPITIRSASERNRACVYVDGVKCGTLEDSVSVSRYERSLTLLSGNHVFAGMHKLSSALQYDPKMLK